KFQTVRIRELAPVQSDVTSYDLNALYEIEMTAGDWKWPANPGGHTHRICRRWLGEDAEPLRNVGASSEWHAGLWYNPRNATPGTTLLLEIEVILQRSPWPRLDTPFDQVDDALNNSPFITLRNYVRVYLSP